MLRCIALAEALQRQNVEPVFAVDQATIDTVSLLRSAAFEVIVAGDGMGSADVVGSAGAVIFDGYQYDRTVEARWRERVPCRVVLDDLADRHHDCEILVDATPGRLARDYSTLVPPQCDLLTGPDYALLRADFLRLRDAALARRSSARPRRLLVSMGLTDVGGITRRVVEGVLAADLDLSIDVVVGRPGTGVEALASAPDAKLRVHAGLDAAAMADLMASADMAIGAGGGTSFERLCLGLPSLVIVLAENQRLMARSMAEAGAIRVVGDLASVTPQHIASAVRAFVDQGDARMACSRAASVLVDGKGADRVCRSILGRLKGRG